MEYLEIASIALSISSTIAIAIAAGLIRYALNVNERLARLETCIRSIKEDIADIKEWYRRLNSDIENAADRITRMEERIRFMR